MLRRVLVPQRRFDPSTPEMIAMPNADPLLLRDELRNLRIINRYFGGRTSVRKGLSALATRVASGRTITILDLGTGSGDQAIEAARLFRSLGRPARITALDNNAIVLSEARAMTAAFDEVTVEPGDIRSLPYADGSFDIVLCSLTAHHFSEDDVVALLREMDRLSNAGFLLHELARNRFALAVAWLYTRISTTNIMTRTDAIASLYAAFTKDELASLAKKAGIAGPEITREPLFRLNFLRRK